ncbi:MAG: ImmA/IrrE family metallo-endopeptidase [Nitrospirae bacterium]|nr:ImmA/IrrE family metallo-endopeptidase [Nitrospirota bacterium]
MSRVAISRVAVREGVLRWAVNRAGLTPDDLQKKFPKIQQWVTGESQPTFRQLESLAKSTLTPLGFFFLPEPPEERLPIPHFRTLGGGTPDRPSPNLLDTVQMMQRRQSWMREFLIDQGQEPLPYVRSAQPEEQPTAIVNRLRRLLRFDEEWAAQQPTWTGALRALREAIEDAGILVVFNGIVDNNTHRKLDPGEFRGFVLVDEYAPLVFVNGSDGKAAQMFTLAHELAHVFLGSSAAFDLREMQPADDPIEQVCNRVAAEFLVPERRLREVWPSIQDDPNCFQTIARQFKVSVLVAARRTLDIGLIQKNMFLDFYRGYQQDERRAAARRPKGGDFFASQNLRVGRRFASAVVRAAGEGNLLYSEAYQLTGLYGKTFDRYAASLRIGRPQ